MTDDERLAELERRVLVLEGRSEAIDRSERRLLEAARQWARVKQLGHYLEGGHITHVAHSDRGDMEETFLGEMRRAALDLLNLEAKPR
jgi:hypothetical protein